jgi:hypothetical protein
MGLEQRRALSDRTVQAPTVVSFASLVPFAIKPLRWEEFSVIRRTLPASSEADFGTLELVAQPIVVGLLSGQIDPHPAHRAFVNRGFLRYRIRPLLHERWNDPLARKIFPGQGLSIAARIL